LNALFFLVLILTGLSMQYSDPDAPLISFPVSVELHNISGIGLTINYLLFLLGNLFSKNGKNYRIEWKGARLRMMKQFRYYVSGYLRKEKPPYPVTIDRKFNPLQAFSYALAMYVGVPVLCITGFGLLFPEAILDRIFGVSGLLVADLVHVITGFLLSVFMIVHIYLCTLGLAPGRHFKAIITGWYEPGTN
jgi:thiosulfate reductase cytochrome b subunit